MTAKRDRKTEVFHLILIRPTHYDDEGYLLQWRHSYIPANTLACLNGIAEDCLARDVLGETVELRISAIDETNRRVRPDKLISMIRRDRARARDQAVTPPDADELKLSLYQETRGTAQAIEKRQRQIVRSARAKEGRRQLERVGPGDKVLP